MSAIVACAPDGQSAATACADGTVRLWDCSTGKERLAVRAALGEVTALAYSPDGARLVAAGAEGKIRLWEASGGREIGRIGGEDRVSCVSFSRDGKRLASGGADRTLRLWDPETGQLIAKLAGFGESIRCLAFSPDG